MITIVLIYDAICTWYTLHMSHILHTSSKAYAFLFFTSREDNARKCLTLLIKENMKRVELMLQAILSFSCWFAPHVPQPTRYRAMLSLRITVQFVLLLSSDILSTMVDQKTFRGEFYYFILLHNQKLKLFIIYIYIYMCVCVPHINSETKTVHYIYIYIYMQYINTWDRHVHYITICILLMHYATIITILPYKNK